MDPGPKFWFQGSKQEEIRNEALELDRSEAEKRLAVLYENQKITANDMGIFDADPKESQVQGVLRLYTPV